MEETETKSKSVQRNYSFLNKNQDKLDVVIDGNKEYEIPSTPGTSYWAILKFCYENHDKPMMLADILDGAREIYRDFNPEKWENFVNKTKVTTVKNGTQVKVEANSWQKRLETNVKTLTRTTGNNRYGDRLTVRGHILRWEPDLFDGKGGFILRTDTNAPLPKDEKVKSTNLSKIE